MAKVRNKINTNKYLCIKRADESLKDNPHYRINIQNKHLLQQEPKCPKGICQFTSREMPDCVAKSARFLIAKCQISKTLLLGMFQQASIALYKYTKTWFFG
jgi:hypothetical protein